MYHIKGTFIKKNNQQGTNDAYVKFLCVCVFFFFFFVFNFFIKAYVVGIHLNYSQCNSNGYPQHMPL